MIFNFDIFMQLNRNFVTLELPSSRKNYKSTDTANPLSLAYYI